MRNRFARVTAIVVAAIFAASNYMSAAAAGANNAGNAGQSVITETRDSTDEESKETPSEDEKSIPIPEKKDPLKDELSRLVEEADDRAEEEKEALPPGVNGKVAGIVKALNENEGYDFAGFTVDKQSLLDAIAVAKTAINGKLAAEDISEEDKSALSDKLEGLDSAEASISELESDKVALTDEIGTLADSESLLTGVLAKLAGNDVSEINANAYWKMISREIIFENGDEPVSIFFKDGGFYTDEDAGTKVENLAEFDEYLAEKGVDTTVVEDDEHFGGYVIEDKKNPDEEIRMSDHEGNFLIEDSKNISTGSIAKAVESNVISLEDGDGAYKLFSDGETIYSDVERIENVDNVGGVNGIKLDEANNHLSAYYLVDENDEYVRDDEGHKVKFVDVEGNVSEDADLSGDVTAKAARFNEIELRSGAEDESSKTVFLSDGEFYTDTELESGFNGTDTEGEDYSEFIEDSEKGHFAGLFLADKGGEYVTVPDGEDENKVAVLNADGSLRSYDDIAADAPIKTDVMARALYYRETSQLVSEDYVDTDFSLLDKDYDELGDKDKRAYDELVEIRDSESTDFGVFMDDERVFEDETLSRQMDELDVPIPEESEDIKEWYAYDGDECVLRLEPVVGLRYVESEEDESDESDEEGFELETYFVAYIAHNIDDEPIFVINSDGTVDYGKTSVEVEDPEAPDFDGYSDEGANGAGYGVVVDENDFELKLPDEKKGDDEAGDTSDDKKDDNGGQSGSDEGNGGQGGSDGGNGGQSGSDDGSQGGSDGSGADQGSGDSGADQGSGDSGDALKPDSGDAIKPDSGEAIVPADADVIKGSDDAKPEGTDDGSGSGSDGNDALPVEPGNPEVEKVQD